MPNESIKKFTDNYVKGLKPEDKVYTISCNSLLLKVSPTGSKVWQFNYRFDGKSGKKLTIGKYPQFSLADANEAVELARDLLSRNIDPAVNAKSVKIATIQSAQFTVKSLTDRFLAEYNNAGDRTKKDYKSLLDNHVLPKYKNIPAADLTRAHAKDIFAIMKEKGIERRVTMARKMIQTIWRWANQEEILENNPFTALTDDIQNVTRDRYLSSEEIPVFLNGLQSIESANMRTILTLQLFLARRESEVCGMQWNEIKLKEAQWIIPVKREVNGELVSGGLKVHRAVEKQISGFMVPLPKIAVEILKKHRAATKLNRTPFVFISNPNNTSPIDVTSLKTHWKRIGLKEKLTPHDLRRTAITHFARLGISDDISSRIAGHSVNDKVKKTYNLFAYLDEKRAALELWSAEIQRLVDSWKEEQELLKTTS